MRFNLGQKSQPHAITSGCVLELLLLRKTGRVVHDMVLEMDPNHCLLFDGVPLGGEATRGEKRSISISR